MSRFSVFPWTTSVGVHATVFAVLGSLFTVAPVERPTIAGSRAVISSTFAAPPPTFQVSQPVLVQTPVAVPDSSEPVTDSVSNSDAADRLKETFRSLPPLNLQSIQRPHGLPPVPRSTSVLKRQPEAMAASTSPRAQPPIETTFASPIERTEVRRAERPAEALPQPQPVRRNPLPRVHAVPVQSPDELVDDIAAMNPPATPRPVGTTETRAARPLDNPSPLYPLEAVRREIEGVVILRVTIGAQGSVSDVEVATGSGHRMLDEAALDAVRRWRFHPARRDGQPVTWTARLPIRFRLQSSGR